jgi:hypothetical protein
VLVATMSFWEGVDVPGRALRLVILDKIPFAVPSDPVVAARSADQVTPAAQAPTTRAAPATFPSAVTTGTTETRAPAARQPAGSPGSWC